MKKLAKALEAVIAKELDAAKMGIGTALMLS
jgi:hypothetical protein